MSPDFHDVMLLVVGFVCNLGLEAAKRKFGSKDRREEQSGTLALREIELSAKEHTDLHEWWQIERTQNQLLLERATTAEAKNLILEAEKTRLQVEVEMVRRERDAEQKEKESLESQNAVLARRVRELEARGPLKRRVLVIDDEADYRGAMVLHVKHAGFDCEGAASGPIALQRLQTAFEQGLGFDLILLDQSMPNMSGAAVANILQASGRILKIVFVTAHARPRDGIPGNELLLDGKNAEELGALAIWPKPPDWNELRANLESLFA